VRSQGCTAKATHKTWIDGGADCCCAGRIEFAHLRSRGAGGKDEGNGVGLCTRHHREQHAMGLTSFERHYGLDLRVHAERLWAHHQTQEAR
jgi:hypothetical protein